jgi:cytochrome c553
MLESLSGDIRRGVLVIAILVGAAGWGRGALATGDIAAGKAAAAPCAACHGSDGISRQPGIPSLAGQHAGYIQAALIAYRSGARKTAMMQGVLAPLSEQDIANISAYYASLRGFNTRPKDVGAQAAVTPEPDPYAAAKKASQTCAGCHGADGNVSVPGTPALAGQHAAYLIAAIKSYQEGSRNAPMMQALAKMLTPSDVEDVAYYLAAMKPLRSDTPVRGDRYAGVAVAGPCATCHGQDGNGTDPKTPRLAGLDSQYLEMAINGYKDGTRTHDVMRAQVSVLGAKDAKDLAAFYASSQPIALPVRKLLTVAEWTERCNRCHGAKGNSTDTRFPVLAGQDEAYLAMAIGLYHLGERSNELMFAMSFLMTEADMKKLAAYYARQRKE